jgi:hypothetical protein
MNTMRGYTLIEEDKFEKKIIQKSRPFVCLSGDRLGALYEWTLIEFRIVYTNHDGLEDLLLLADVRSYHIFEEGEMVLGPVQMIMPPLEIYFLCDGVDSIALRGMRIEDLSNNFGNRLDAKLLATYKISVADFIKLSKAQNIQYKLNFLYWLGGTPDKGEYKGSITGTLESHNLLKLKGIYNDIFDSEFEEEQILAFWEKMKGGYDPDKGYGSVDFSYRILDLNKKRT